MDKPQQSKLVETLKRVNNEFFEEFKNYLRHVHPLWKDKVENPDEVRWFCCQSEQEQLGYLAHFITEATGRGLFQTVKQIVIQEFLKEKEERAAIKQALMRVVHHSEEQLPVKELGKMRVVD